MEYKNTKTGVTFSSHCVISGGDWDLVEKERVSNNSLKKEVSTQVESNPNFENKKDENELDVDKETKTGDATLDSITKEQIMQELDAFGIEYNKSANKPELYDLMMSQGK